MNKTKIEWCDYTWNPVTGCKKGCPYCYAEALSKRFKRSFEPQFHEDRLYQPTKIGVPSKIFVCSMGELFGNWVPQEWIRRIIDVVEKCPQHTFIFLTKAPQGLEYIDFPPNCWIGTSIDQQKTAISRHFLLDYNVEHNIRFISFEPLLEPIKLEHLNGINWIIIGGKTGHNPFIPPKAWVDDLIQQARKHKIPVFLKNNLHYPQRIQEYPHKYSQSLITSTVPTISIDVGDDGWEAQEEYNRRWKDSY